MSSVYRISGLNNILIGIGCLLLVGCIPSEMSDLEEYVRKIKQEEPPPIASLPEFPPDKFELFQCSKDPFESFEKEKQKRHLVPVVEDKTVRPDCKRPDVYANKQPLESFPLDSLKMVGTIELGEDIWGLVQEPEKKYMIHQVKENDRLGLNFGKIVAITEKQIHLIEMLPDDSGCYLETPRKLELITPK